MSDHARDLDDLAFRTFAEIYPHEAHDLDPDRFWNYFHELRPGADRATMERILLETSEACDQVTP